MALPANDKVIGDLGHTDDHNAIVDDITDVRATYLPSATASATYLAKDEEIDGGSP